MWIANSNAKINLGLHVLEQLPTGYHRIETGLCFLEWNNRLEVQPAESMNLEVTDETISTDENNLINQAIKVLQRYVGLEQKYHTNVKKRIPAGAGLGSAAGNAALILRIINKIEDLGLNEDDLIDLGRELGTEIPFFIKGETGIARDMGHNLDPLPIQPKFWIVTCCPNETSSAAEAYRYCEPNPEPEFSLKRILTEEEPDQWRFMLFNELEQAVFQRVEVAGNLKDQFYEFGAIYASMSGSGPAVYGLFDQDFVATDAYNHCLI